MSGSLKQRATVQQRRFGAGIERCIALTLLMLFAACAYSKEEFLRPEQAFKYSARVQGDQLTVTWKVEPGYYLYKHRLGFISSTPNVEVGAPQWPQGENHHDEFFGDQEIYRGNVDFSMPLTFTGERPRNLALQLKLQGCADAGLCYPPATWKTEVDVPAASTGGGLASFFRSASRSASQQNDFLPPDQAFRFGASMERPDAIALTWIIADDYYLYRDQIKVSTDRSDVQLGKLQLPAGKAKTDEYYGDTVVFYEVLEATLPIARAADTTGTLNLTVSYQGCAEAGLCYNPITKTVALELPPTDVAATLPADVPASASGTGNAGEKVAEQDRLATLIRDGNLGLVLATFFGLGVLLSFTPCVLPMIPILSGIIVGQGGHVTATRGFSLAFTYVQGMALTYAAAGAAFVLAFNQAPQAFFQKPWIIVLFALLFIALALAMFGTYTLQMPSAIQTRLTDVSNKQKSGTYVGTFIMGALSALVVTACVAPAIIAALSVISQTGQIGRGAGALYATGLGMGVPLLIVGASAGTLLPKVGPWMDTVKQLFGVLFLAVAIYLLTPLLPGSSTLALWSALAVIAGFWMFSLKTRDDRPAAAPVRAIGLLAVIYGILLLVGAASGSRDPLQPLDNLRISAGSAVGAAQQHGLDFKIIKSVADLERELLAARQSGQPVMLDFYADWCVACKEMEKYTFTDAGVQNALATAVLLQADVTANDDLDQALLKRFDVFGPPTIAFFDVQGEERKNFRLVGFTPANEFREHVLAAFGQS